MGYATYTRGLIALSAILVALLVPAAAGAQQLAPGGTGLPEPSSPDLIDRAQEVGTIDNERANLYRVYALTNDARLPAAYESSTPFDGTLELRQARRELRRMEPGTERNRVAAALRAPPPDPNLTFCDALSAAPLPDSVESDHFYIQYNEAALGEDLTIDDYMESLDAVWETEVGVFGWAAPPLFPDNPAPDDLYHVRIDALGPVLYGFVSSLGTYAGPVGNNPNSAWDDEDADASCMGLNQDYSTFPSPPRKSLDATTAHEFNHSLQFGYGGLSGDNVPDDNFIEGGATWMEDEAQDAANDNYFYLYPQFDDSMGEHDEGDIYAYWLTWRGLTERFGTNTAGAGEQVMQDFWELTSKNQASNLEAMNAALVIKGTTLPDAYHDYAIAAKFMAPCGATYVVPYCFEEAAGYVGTAGETEPHGEVSAVGGSFSGSVEDNYALNWVVLPTTGGPYDVNLSNDSAGGQLRATVACDTGSQITRVPLPNVVGSGADATASAFNPAGCDQVVAVITNQSQTAPNPDSSAKRAYTLSVTTPAGPGNPNTTITSGPEDVITTDSATFTFTSTDDAPEFECRLDSSVEADWASCTSPDTRSNLEDGSHTFEVRSIDPDTDNTDPTPARRTFTVDTTPPDTEITDGPTGTTSSRSVTFEFLANDATTEDGATFECRLDSGDEASWSNCSSPETLSGLSDGSHTFDVRATDGAGNIDPSPASRTFTVQPPSNAGTGGFFASLTDTVDPLLTRLRLSSRRFRAARVGRAISAAPLGTRVSYRLSEAATVRVRYERRVTGRRVGSRCRAVSRRNRSRERCLRFGLVSGLARRRGGTAGANSFRLTGRMNGRALSLGVYRLRLSARDGAGNASSTRRSGSFRIVRR